jgi:flavin-dependent dehydrogenase
MLRTVVLGAGPVGAATALFLARRGHHVTILDRDPLLEQPARPRVPHVRQGHSFLALGTAILDAELPDVVDKLLTAGAVRVPLPRDSSHWNLLSRRQLFDHVFRECLSKECGVCFLPGTTVTGLLVEHKSGVAAHVFGVKTREHDIRADIVIDACGCQSPAPRWLAAHQTELKISSDHSHFFYLTRHCRLRPSSSFPSVRIPILVLLDYTSVLAFPEDNGHFQLTIQLLRTDPSSRALRDPATFDRFLAEVPFVAPWLEAGERISDPEIVGTVGNVRRQTFFGKPLVTGFLLVGDAAFHTNPSAARGVALGLAHAQALANLLHDASHERYDPATMTETWERATSRLFDPHMESQVRIDRQRIAQIRCSLEGRVWDGANDTYRLAQALMEYRDCDVVGAAADRVFNLLSTPQEFYANGEVMRRVVRRMRARSSERPALGPTRNAYERLVG